MKRIFGMVLFVAVMLIALCGCGAEKNFDKELIGSWYDSVEGIPGTVIMEFSKDNTLVCYQEKPSVRKEMFFNGDWEYDGRAVTLHIVDVDDEETYRAEGTMISGTLYVEIDGVELSLTRKDT